MSTVSVFAVYERMVLVGVMVCPVTFIGVPNSGGSGLPSQVNISPSTLIMPPIPINLKRDQRRWRVPASFSVLTYFFRFHPVSRKRVFAVREQPSIEIRRPDQKRMINRHAREVAESTQDYAWGENGNKSSAMKPSSSLKY